MNAYLLRIKKIIEEKNLSESAFGRMIGVKQSALNNMFVRNSVPKSNVMHKIYTTFGVNIKWLITGEGEIFQADDPQSESDEGEIPSIFPRHLSQPTNNGIDIQKLSDAIEIVDDALYITDRVMPPRKKAGLIILIYERLLKNSKEREPILKLVKEAI